MRPLVLLSCIQVVSLLSVSKGKQMDNLLSFCSALLLLTGGFIVVTLWFVLTVLFIIEVRDNYKERGSEKEEDVRQG